MCEIKTFTQWCMIQEINLRGGFMMQSCDLEMALLHIMLYCIAGVTEPEVIKRKFKGMMMNDKIKQAIIDLKTHKPNYYTKYEQYFEELAPLKTLRNQMAHCKIFWNDQSDANDTSFEFVEIAKDNEEEKFELKKINISEAQKKLFDFRGIILKIAELADILQKEYNGKTGEI
jgi:hypothetical protein